MNTRLQNPTQAKSEAAPSQETAPRGLLQRKCACGGNPGLGAECPECRDGKLISAPPLVQTKLVIGQPGDKYEREADRVADAVMRMPDRGRGSGDTTSDSIKPLAILPSPAKDTSELSRQPLEEEEEFLQTKVVSEPVGKLRRQPLEEEEELLQPKTPSGRVPEVTSGLHSRIKAQKGGGQALSPSARRYLEPRFGHDFGSVRVHADGNSAQVARAVRARAFTVGRDVVFGAGDYRPATQAGRTLIAHELVHVLQQRETPGAFDPLGVPTRPGPSADE